MLKEKKLSFYEWIKCFRVLKSTRLSHYPNELQGMLRHEEIVQDLHSQGKDGMYYDAQFRRRKHQHPHIGWWEYLADIVNNLPPLQGSSATLRQGTRALRPRLRLSNPRANYYTPPTMPMNFVATQPKPMRFPQPQYRPRPICNFYNTPAGCLMQQCRFSHACKKCGRPGYSVQQCFQNSRQQN